MVSVKCICDFMPNSHKKSWMVSTGTCTIAEASDESGSYEDSSESVSYEVSNESDSYEFNNELDSYEEFDDEYRDVNAGPGRIGRPGQNGRPKLKGRPGPNRRPGQNRSPGQNRRPGQNRSKCHSNKGFPSASARFHVL